MNWISLTSLNVVEFPSGLPLCCPVRVIPLSSIAGNRCFCLGDAVLFGRWEMFWSGLEEVIILTGSYLLEFSKSV